MNYQNIRQAKAIEKKNRERLLKINPQLPDTSGIYFLTRTDENGFKYGYVGQAVHILQRLCSHLVGYQQHIDLSLKRHGLYDEEKNPYGWNVNFLRFPQSELDEKEQYYIKQYALNGYQMRNVTGGSQGKGKVDINERKPTKGYRDGIEQGMKNCSKEMAHLFDLHLDVTTKKNPPTVNQQKALDKFNDFLNFYKGSDENG